MISAHSLVPKIVNEDGETKLVLKNDTDETIVDIMFYNPVTGAPYWAQYPPGLAPTEEHVFKTWSDSSLPDDRYLTPMNYLFQFSVVRYDSYMVRGRAVVKPTA